MKGLKCLEYSPSAFSMTLGLPDSIMATQELVVPRSIPIMLNTGDTTIRYEANVKWPAMLDSTYVLKFLLAAAPMKALLTWLLRALFLISELNIVFAWLFS